MQERVFLRVSALGACIMVDLHKVFLTQEEGMQSPWEDILWTEQNINISEYSVCLSGENADSL